jgi:hypothetical protein
VIVPENWRRQTDDGTGLVGYPASGQPNFILSFGGW